MKLTQARVPLTREVAVRDETGAARTIHIPAERPLTVFVDKREIVTLMTLGMAPEWLEVGPTPALVVRSATLAGGMAPERAGSARGDGPKVAEPAWLALSRPRTAPGGDAGPG